MSGGQKAWGGWVRRARVVPALLCACLAVSACLGSERMGVLGATVSRRTESSREYLPARGGQTIVPPERMADVATLWQPLSAQERRRIAKTLPPEESARLHALGGEHPWLPESEREVMESYLYRLTVSHADVTGRSLQRASVHLPMIRAVLAEKGLPPELASLPLVESAFETTAVSPAGAAGLWQLMPATARRFGLEVSKNADERFDPEKATRAATAYLAWLHGCFGDWPLALAAYNCGEGSMNRALRRCGGGSLSGLTSWCRTDAGLGTLQEETLRFVPQFVAAVRVMNAAQERPPRTLRESVVAPPAERERAPESREREGRLQTLTPAVTEGPFRQRGVSSKTAPPPMRRLPPSGDQGIRP